MMPMAYRGGSNSRYSTTVTLTEKHVEKLQEQFNQMDLDGSGTLAANELHMGLVGAGHKVTMKQCRALVAAVEIAPDAWGNKVWEQIRSK